VSSNLADGGVCSMQLYVIKFVSDLRQVVGLFPISSTNKPDRHDITELLLTVTLALTITELEIWWLQIEPVNKYLRPLNRQMMPWNFQLQYSYIFCFVSPKYC
jgi:hypothetical protein